MWQFGACEKHEATKDIKLTKQNMQKKKTENSIKEKK
jgi:hypothetical protein